MHETKNIIFDLGGVLLDLDFQRSVDAFKKLGVENFDAMFSQFKADQLFEKLETGMISENEFYKKIRERTVQVITNADIDSAWNALILHFRIQSLAFLEKLEARYRIYLLSNTNSIHLRHFQKLFGRETGKPLLDVYFRKAWYSHEIRLRKPGARVFEYVLQQEKLRAAETFFIDDTVGNIETARRLGFKTHLLLPQERIEMLDFS